MSEVMTREQLEEIEARIREDEIAISKRWKALVDEKVRTGNHEMAERGIAPGDSVKFTGDFTRWRNDDLTAIFQGYEPSPYGKRAEPVFKKIKADGTASRVKAMVPYGCDIKRI